MGARVDRPAGLMKRDEMMRLTRDPARHGIAVRDVTAATCAAANGVWRRSPELGRRGDFA
jgi:hypothetical protein